MGAKQWSRKQINKPATGTPAALLGRHDAIEKARLTHLQRSVMSLNPGPFFGDIGSVLGRNDQVINTAAILRHCFEIGSLYLKSPPPPPVSFWILRSYQPHGGTSEGTRLNECVYSIHT